MSDDMSDLMQKMNDMIKNNEIPDSIKNMVSLLSNSSNNGKMADNNSTGANNGNLTNVKLSESSRENVADENGSSSGTDFDLNTMLKMKSIIDSMNKQQNDPRANLLRSLKPYLRTSRKDKVDQYIKLFSMGKVFEMMNPLGGKEEK